MVNTNKQITVKTDDGGTYILDPYIYSSAEEVAKIVSGAHTLFDAYYLSTSDKKTFVIASHVVSVKESSGPY